MSSDKPKDSKIPPLPKYSFKEIAKHNKSDDCWIILGSKVYNVTSFLNDHPGGSEILMEHAGNNATDGFIEAGHVSNYSIIQMMKDFLIGVVSEEKTSNL